MNFDSLELKFFDAYRTTQRQGVMDQLRARGVLAADLEGIADRIIADAARAHAADFRERLPISIRQSYADRAHWRSGFGRQGTPVADEKLVRISTDRCVSQHLTVEEIIEVMGDFKLTLQKGAD